MTTRLHQEGVGAVHGLHETNLDALDGHALDLLGFVLDIQLPCTLPTCPIREAMQSLLGARGRHNRRERRVGACALTELTAHPPHAAHGSEAQATPASYEGCRCGSCCRRESCSH